MSYLAKKKRSFAMRCLVRCRNLVMFFLIFSLMVLLAGLGLSIYYDEIPIPDRILQTVSEELDKQGVNLRFRKITLDFKGDLLIRNAQLSFTRSDEPVFQADQIYLDVNYASLILRKAPFNTIQLANGTIFSPAVVSLSGTTDHLVDRINLELTKHWSDWHLNFLTAKFQHLDIVANGPLTALVAELAKSRKKEVVKPDLYLEYLKLARMLTDYSKHLKSLELPTVEVQFSSPSNSDFAIEIKSQAQSFSKEGLPRALDLRQQGTVQILPELKLKDPLQLNVRKVAYADFNIEVQNIALSAWKADPLEKFEDLFPIRVKANTGFISVEGNTIDQAVFNGELLNRDEADGSLIAALYEGAIHASLRGNWTKRTAEGFLTGSVNLEKVFARPEFDHLWKLRWSKQHRPLYLDAEFVFPGNLEGLETEFRVETRDIDIIKTPFQWARARGTLTGTWADISQLEAGGYGNDLFCTFRQDLKEPFYLFTMVGRFRPHDIDVWWRDWWKNTFDYLHIKGDLPFLDLAIRNAFKFKKQLTLFGYAEAENIDLKGMHFDKATTRLFIRPNYIDAFDLNLVRPEGKATGQFQRQLVQGALKNVIVDITSAIDLEPSMELFGESGKKIIQPYTWDGNPTIFLLGEFNFEKGENWQDLTFKIDTDQPMTLYDFPFDSLKVNGHYDHGNVLLQDVSFGFAGGQGEGELSYLKQDDQAFLLFDLNIENAELEETLKRIAKVKKPEEGKSPVEKPTQEKESEPMEGKVKIHASGISPAGYGLDRVMAKGELEITDGNLAQIPLFGPLSSLIPFTKLRLNTAKSFFAWDDGKMTFPNLVMTGKTARLEGVGDYYTNNSRLDFQVRVYLLRETDIPLISNIIMPIFDPFSQMAGVNLKGTLSKPEWRFAISPLNLFDEKVETRKPEDLERLLDFEFRR